MLYEASTRVAKPIAEYYRRMAQAVIVKTGQSENCEEPIIKKTVEKHWMTDSVSKLNDMGINVGEMLGGRKDNHEVIRLFCVRVMVLSDSMQTIWIHWQNLKTQSSYVKKI